MQKGQTPVLILVGILIIMAVAGGAYFLGMSVNPKPSPTSDETSNWKVYSNPSLGISFSYPKDLNYLYDQFGFNHPNNPEGNLMLQNFDGSKPTNNDSSNFQLQIEAYKKPDQTSLDAYVKNPNKVWNTANSQTFASLMLGNEAALGGISIQKNEKVPTVWVAHKGYIFTIYLETPKSTHTSWFAQILSTLKFQ